MKSSALRNIHLLAMIMMLFAISACRKPLPAEPLDIRRPPFDADIVIRALDLTTTVPGLDVELTDPDGHRYTGSTDSTGVLLFDFPDMTRGLWRAFVPQQGRYYDSEITFEAKGGVNDVTFQSSPRLILSPLAEPVTYSYSTDTFIPMQLVYDQGGALRVPVSITSSPLPAGWNVSYPVKLGKETNGGMVTVAIPAGQYQQPVLNYFGYSEPITDAYVRTDVNPVPITLYRGFPVTLFLEFSWTTSFSMAGFQLSGSYMFYQTHGANIPWSGSLRVGRASDTSAYFSTPLDFTGTTSGPWSRTMSAAEAQNELVFTVNIESPGFGGYNVTHPSGVTGNSPGNHITRVPEQVY